MSFYGDIKRVQSSPYVFDQYFPNRSAMDTTATTDGVYIGRYVLIKYTCKYVSESDKTLVYFNKYNKSNSTYEPINLTSTTYQKNKYYTLSGSTYSLATGNFNANTQYYMLIKQISNDYANNVKADINKYKDTFDGTVWQKIYSQGVEKYIMVAELNAAVPKIELEIVNPKYFYNNEEKWRIPEFDAAASSEDSYKLKMPQPLKLSVSSLTSDFYAGNLLDPRERKQLTLPDNKTAFDTEYNYVGWQNYLDGDRQDNTGNYDEIDEKRLEMKFYAFGQMISDLYDVMYGVPKTGVGSRPFFTDNLSAIVPKYDKGLVGILTSIATDYKGNISYDSYGRRMNPGLYYYFFSKWGDATEDPNNFIENIPQVVGSQEERGAGKAHYRIDFVSGKLVTSS